MYSKKLVAFIDLLGFTKSVESKDFDEVRDILKEFQSMISKSSQHAYRLSKTKTTLEEQKEKLTFFSDCVVWTYDLSSNKRKYFLELTSLLSMFFILQVSLHFKGILIRGGVTYDSIYQNNTAIFGNGLIKSYRLEKKAKYPIILFDKILLDRLDKEFLPYLESRITINDDGNFYSDIFGQFNMINQKIIKSKDEEEIHILKDLLLKDYIEDICKIIRENQNHKESSIKEKYDWLKAKLISIDNLQVDINI